ncbi:unnamed protein product [Prunus armeniaca]
MCDASVEKLSRDLEFVESVSKHDTNRTAGVDQDATDVKVGDVSTNDQWVAMGEDDTTLFLLSEGNRGLT